MMAYHRGNYSFVIDSSFTPFSMQEMLVPFVAYKEAFDKAEEDYINLNKDTNTLAYLEERLKDNPDSKAAQIYTGYMNDLKPQVEDFSKYGLTMNNGRALTNLKRRYEGEIGRLMKADERLRTEQNLRRQMSAKDPSMLYAEEALDIDQYLDDGAPNLYSISGNELYSKAAAASQAASKRVFSVNGDAKTLGDYYYDYVQKMGYTPEQLRQFGDQISTDFSSWAASNIPELGLAANQILEANGVNENLTGNNLSKAQQQVIRGLIDGAVYTESHNPQRDLGVLTKSEQVAADRAADVDKRAQEQWDIQKNILYRQKDDGTWELNPNYANENYEIDPNTGNLKKKPGSATAEEKKEEKLKTEKNDVLKKLGKDELRNEKGFDVPVGDERHHYDYIGAVVGYPDEKWHSGLFSTPKGKKWASGLLDEDFAGELGWALWSDTNVIDSWGDYSVTRPRDKAKRRVLAKNEVAALEEDVINGIEDNIVKSGGFTERTIKGVMEEHSLNREEAIKTLQESGYKYISDYQVVAVENNKGDDDYLIAVRTK